MKQILNKLTKHRRMIKMQMELSQDMAKRGRIAKRQHDNLTADDAEYWYTLGQYDAHLYDAGRLWDLCDTFRLM